MTDITPGADPLLTEEQTAEFLNVSMRALQAWRTNRTGPAFVRLGRLVRYRMSALLEFLNDNKNRSWRPSRRRRKPVHK